MLSTPPAFILSQDQTLMLKFWFQSKFAWLILTVITVVLVLFWMFSWTSRLNQKPLFLEFSGFYILFSFQGSWCFRIERRRRDLNPRAATNDLLPFQGSPFNLLGTSAGWFLYLMKLITIFETERVGFEPTRPFGQTVFKTASLWPLRYLSKNVLNHYIMDIHFCQGLFHFLFESFHNHLCVLTL